MVMKQLILDLRSGRLPNFPIYQFPNLPIFERPMVPSEAPRGAAQGKAPLWGNLPVPPNSLN
jgi:hypothetical protein